MKEEREKHAHLRELYERDLLCLKRRKEERAKRLEDQKKRVSGKKRVSDSFREDYDNEEEYDQ